MKYSIGNEVGIFWSWSCRTEWRQLLIYVIYFSFLHNLQRIYPSWERILWEQCVDRFHMKYWKYQNLSTSRKKTSLQKTILIICLRSTVIKVYMKQTVKCLFYCLCVLSLVYNSLRPPWTVPARLLCPCNFPGKNTGVNCHYLLQGIFSTRRLKLCLLHCLHRQVDFYHCATWEAHFIAELCDNSQ